MNNLEGITLAITAEKAAALVGTSFGLYLLRLNNLV